MRTWKAICMLGVIFLLAGCNKESVYTLSATEVEVEVNDKDFDPIDYLRKDGVELSAEEKKKIKTGAKVDVHALGTYTFNFPEYDLNLNVSVVDTQAPQLSLLGFSVEQGVVFTWTEENLAKLKAQAKDNYDAGELLKKTLTCGSVDTSKPGDQTITCSVEDSSGNRGSASVKISVKETK